MKITDLLTVPVDRERPATTALRGFGLSTILTTAAAKVDARAELAYATASQTTTEAVTNIRTVRALRAEVGGFR